jgi:hypothetical protein
MKSSLNRLHVRVTPPQLVYCPVTVAIPLHEDCAAERLHVYMHGWRPTNGLKTSMFT